MNNNFGNYIAELRKKRKLSQKKLAELTGISQSAISRLESEVKLPCDYRLLSKLANALDAKVNEIVPEGFLENSNELVQDSFYAFCPNPFCTENTRGIDSVDRTPFVAWDSKKSYPSTQFEEINYCGSCRTELVKDCPGCHKRLTAKGTKFCVRCGQKICGRPDQDDLEKIFVELTKEIVEPERNLMDHDIPF